MPTARFSVTADDIAKGFRRSHRSCPVALAVKRVVAAPVCVCRALIGFYPAGTEDHQMTDAGMVGHAQSPPQVRGFIDDFDNGYRVRPFDFELEIPAGVPLQEPPHADPAG